jgi:hypothetical protein
MRDHNVFSAFCFGIQLAEHVHGIAQRLSGGAGKNRIFSIVRQVADGEMSLFDGAGGASFGDVPTTVCQVPSDLQTALEQRQLAQAIATCFRERMFSDAGAEWSRSEEGSLWPETVTRSWGIAKRDDDDWIWAVWDRSGKPSAVGLCRHEDEARQKALSVSGAEPLDRRDAESVCLAFAEWLRDEEDLQ